MGRRRFTRIFRAPGARADVVFRAAAGALTAGILATGIGLPTPLAAEAAAPSAPFTAQVAPITQAIQPTQAIQTSHAAQTTQSGQTIQSGQATEAGQATQAGQVTQAAQATQTAQTTNAAQVGPLMAGRLTAETASPANPAAVTPEPVPSGCFRTMNVVAHEDDDLLFINPAVSDDLASGDCVITTYVTGGDSGRTRSYWHGRELGAMAAYAAMTGLPNAWTEDMITVAGHRLTRERLVQSRVTLLFVRLADAHGSPGRPVQTLRGLWSGEIATMRTLDFANIYTRQSLIATLTALMAAYQPEQIRTLDFAGGYGDGDHEDHHTVGFLTYAAQRDYRSPHRIAGYMGYEVAELPDNLGLDQRDEKLRDFLAYAPYDVKVCQIADDCLTNFYGPRFSHSLVTADDAGGGRNVARRAHVVASSANLATGQSAAKAVDSDVTGGSHEWVTRGTGAGSWLQLTWKTPQRLDEVDLYDRQNPQDNITAGVIRFDDGTTVTVGPFPSGAAPLVIRFSPRRVRTLRFTVTAVSRTTRNAGLSELAAYTAG